MKNPLAKNAEKCRRILAEQQVSADRPGTILKDIRTLIEFIGPAGIRTGTSQGNLPSAVLPPLNAQLSHSVELNLKRPLLQDYPNIAGLYILLRVMDLVQADPGRVRINEARRDFWFGLNPAEQYFALLEAWLLYAKGSVITESRRDTFQYRNHLAFLSSLSSSRWKNFDEDIHRYAFLGGTETWDAQLQAQLGLIELAQLPIHGRPSGTRGWIMGAARRSLWGEAVAWAIIEWLNQQQEFESLLYRPPQDAGFGWLQPMFQPHFPEWQKIYAQAQPELHPGIYIFKASLERYGGKSLWRRLAVPHSASLDQIAMAVLDAFKFDDTEHLYEFRYRDQTGAPRVYYHHYCEEGPSAGEISIGDSGLPDKGTLKFLFDFGDCWRFLLRLERIGPPDKKIRRPKLIESAGKAPGQYPDWIEA